MSLIDLPRDPTPRDLTVFVCTGLGLLPAAAALAAQRGHPTLAWILIGSAVLLGLCRIASRRLTRAVYLGVSVAFFPIGWLVSHLVLAVFFFGLLTPLALFFRLIGRDPLHRRWSRNAETYWTPRVGPRDLERYFRQF